MQYWVRIAQRQCLHQDPSHPHSNTLCTSKLFHGSATPKALAASQRGEWQCWQEVIEGRQEGRWLGYDKGDELESKLGEKRDFCRLLLIPEAPTDLVWAQSANHTITSS